MYVNPIYAAYLTNEQYGTVIVMLLVLTICGLVFVTLLGIAYGIADYYKETQLSDRE